MQSPEDTASTRPVMDQLFLQARQLLPALEKGQIIGAYAGLRPKLAPPGEGGYRDFVIREDKPGFVNLVGIESPGLTASLPIARRVAALVGGSLDLSPGRTFRPIAGASGGFGTRARRRRPPSSPLTRTMGRWSAGARPSPGRSFARRWKTPWG
ncbi:MAG: FAD-dependent oxidoreductase [Evtepia gabavorous]